MSDYGATERVRKFVSAHYFEPARLRKDREVTIHAGSLSKILAEKNLLPPNRFPVICGAMTKSRFAERNGAKLIRQAGPKSGQSSAATFTFALDSKGPSHAEAGQDISSGEELFLSLRGVLKETYAQLGGAQAFHEREREEFDR